METINAVSFTGHRPQGLQMLCPRAKRQLRPLLQREILHAAEQGCKAFYSGMAMGVDLIAAEEVLKLRRRIPGIRLIAVLPFRRQDSAYPPDWASCYVQALQAADEVLVLAERYHSSCYRMRNQFLVEHCDRLVAIYNGSAHSGTAQTIRMGERAGKELHIYYPDAEGNWKSRFERVEYGFSD